MSGSSDLPELSSTGFDSASSVDSVVSISTTVLLLDGWSVTTNWAVSIGEAEGSVSSCLKSVVSDIGVFSSNGVSSSCFSGSTVGATGLGSSGIG